MFTSVFLLNIVYFSVCLTSNKLYWIDDQLADVSTRFYTSASWSVGELTVLSDYTLFRLPLLLESVNSNKIAISLQFLTFWVLYFVSSINFFPILFHAWLQVTSILGPIPWSPFHTGKFFEDLSQFIGHHNSGKFKFKMIQM